MSEIVVMDNKSADANYPSDDGIGLTFKQGLIAVYATSWAAASVKLQMRPNRTGAPWADVKDTSGTVVTWTADTVDTPLPYIPSTYKIRAVLTGAVGGEGVTMIISN